MAESIAPDPSSDPEEQSDELTAFPGDLPAPQGGFDDLPSPLPLVAGGLLGLYALKRRDLAGLFAAGIGAGLLYQGAQQNDLVDGGWLPRLLKTRNRRTVPFERQIIIDRPPEMVFEFWRNPQKLAVYLPHIRDVRIVGDGDVTRWQLKLTDALRVEWTAEVHIDESTRRIAWRTRPPSDVHHEGTVDFQPLRDGKSTKMTIRLHMLAPGGKAGAKIVEWLEEFPYRFFAEDLQRLRSVVESDDWTQK